MFPKMSLLGAEPVNLITGEVVVDQQDFSLHGPILIEWKRHYGSQNDYIGVCGYGWETPADARLVFENDGSVVFYDGTGISTYFSSVPIDMPVMEPVGWRDFTSD